MLRAFIFVVWAVFWIYWLISATGARRGVRSRQRTPRAVALIGLLVVGLGLRVVGSKGLGVGRPVLQAIGVILFLSGLAFAVWARVNLGRNWGMPMTEKDEPELVTSGPYRFVRHPIYAGILLATLGTALATNLYWLAVLAVMFAYFAYSAREEERWLTASFPTEYASYRARTKMLIPYLL